MQDSRRIGWKRPVVAVAALGAFTVGALAAPAGAHLGSFGHLKGHIKKIARKVAKKEAKTIVQTTVGPTLFIEEEELVRWGPIELNVGAADQAIGTFGPFTLEAQCLDSDATADTDINIRVGVTTTENNSALKQYYGALDHDFDTGEDGDWYDFIDGSETTNDPGDPQNQQTFGDGLVYVAAPSGASLWGETNAISNFSGSHCWLKGHLLVNG
jgi:hypothetical protein